MSADGWSLTFACNRADAEEVAETIRWLASEAPASLTGSTLDINGASYVR